MDNSTKEILDNIPIEDIKKYLNIRGCSDLMNNKLTRLYLGGISRSTLYRMMREKEIKPTRIGGRVFFSQKELDRYIKKQEVENGI